MYVLRSRERLIGARPHSLFLIVSLVGALSCGAEPEAPTAEPAIAAATPIAPEDCPPDDAECRMGYATTKPANDALVLQAAPRKASANASANSADANAAGVVAQAIPSGSTIVADSLPGSLNVSASGQAGYQLPLQVPIGINGLVPDLQLAYQSSRVNGIVGMGWHLAGFSSIARCPKTTGQDDGAAPISDAADDAFCLDGQRLVAIQGAYGADGTEYRTELESFLRIYSRGNPGTGTGYTGPTSWEVWSPEGRISFYGTGSTTVELKGTVRRTWGVSEVRDRFKNTMSFIYTTQFCEPRPPAPNVCFGSGLVPKEIRYGAHAGSGTNDPVVASDRSVRFVYSTDRADRNAVYERGIVRVLRHRLESIEMTVSGSTAWAYYLRYELGNGGASHLAGVARCAGSPSICTPETLIGYDNTAQATTRSAIPGVSVAWNFGNGLHGRDAGATLVLDANGDGRDDLLTPILHPVPGRPGASTYGLAFGQANGAPFTSLIDTEIGASIEGNSPFFPCISQESVVDFNRDGKDDLIDLCQHPSYGWRVFISTGTSFTPQPLPPSTTSNNRVPMHVADFDGDGWFDLMTCEGANPSYHVLYRNKGGTQGFYPARALPALGRDCEKTAEALLDVDGDGVVNVFRPVHNPYQESQDHGQPFEVAPPWKYLLITPTTAAWVDAPMDVFPPKWTAMDFFPDTDEFSYWIDFPGGNRAPVVTPTSPMWQFKVIDYNGDGLGDLLTYRADAETGPDRVSLYVNNGRGFTLIPAALGSTYSLDNWAFYRAVVTDWDGDGRQDLIIPAGGANTQAPLVLFRAVSLNGPFTPTTFGGTLSRFSVPLPGDFDGDGDRELLFGNEDGTLSYIPATTNAAHLLQTVENGLGRRDVVRYARSPATSNGAYSFTDGCNTSMAECARRVAPLVVKTEVQQRMSSASGAVTYPMIQQSGFSYQNLRIGKHGRGALGFAKTDRFDTEAQGNLADSTTTVYDNSTFVGALAGTTAKNWYPYAGQALTTTLSHGNVVDLADQPLARTESLFAGSLAIKLSADARPFVIAPETTQQMREGVPGQAGTVALSVVSTRAVDGYGNTTSAGLTWKNGSGAVIESRVATTTFQTDAAGRASWLIRCPVESSLASTVNGQTQTRTARSAPCAAPGAPTKVTREPTSTDASLYLQVATSYDVFGNVLNVTSTDITGAIGRTATYGYDARGMTVTSTGEGNLLTTLSSFDPIHGGVLSETAPSGVWRAVAYDALGRTTTVTTADSTSTFTYEVPLRSSLDADIANAGRLRIRRTSPGGEQVEEILDALGRALQTRTSGYLGQTIVEESRYDFADRVVYQSAPHLPGETQQGNTTYNYDALGRLVTSRRTDDSAVGGIAVTQLRYGPTGQADQTGWDAATKAQTINVVKRTSPSTAVDVRGVGHHGQTLVVRDAIGGVTQHAQAPFGLIGQLRDAAGHVTSLGYDVLGRRTSLADPDSGNEQTTYDAYDLPKTVKDASGATASFTYDLLGRVRVHTNADGSTSKYRYDGTSTRAGQLTELTTFNAAGEQLTRLAYDYVPVGTNGAGKLTRVTRTMGGMSFDVHLDYDAYGRMSKLSYPFVDGYAFAVARSYDDNGHLIAVRDAYTNTPYWTLTAADQGYRIGREQAGDGTETQWTYQPRAGRVALLSTYRVGSPSTPLQQIGLEYDAKGELVTRSDSTDFARSRRYEYDLLGRLTRVVRQHGTGTATELERFTYDGIGNLASRSTLGSYVYGSSRPHAVTSVGASTYAYDSRGNQITRTGPAVAGGAQQIDYTPFNLPSRITTGTGAGQTSLDITYDADHRRVYTIDNAGKQTWYADEIYEREQTTSTSAQHRYRIYGPGRVVAEIVRAQPVIGSPTGTASIRYLHADPIGSPDLVTDATGATLERPQFEPFGNTLDASATPSTVAGFTGHRRAENGLIDMRGRYYDPALGRFLSPDPIVDDPHASQALNRYSYVRNRPLKFLDPSGMDPITQPWEIEGPITKPSQVWDEKWAWDNRVYIDVNVKVNIKTPNGAGIGDAGAGTSEPGAAAPRPSGARASTASSSTQVTDAGSRTGNLSDVVDRGGGGAGRAGFGMSMVATAGGFTLGVASTAAIAYGVGALSAVCAPCAVGVGLALVAVAVYQLVDGGAVQLYESGSRVLRGEGTAGDYFVLGSTAGSLAGGRSFSARAFISGQNAATQVLTQRGATLAATTGLFASKWSGAGAELRIGSRVFRAYSGEQVPHSERMTGALMSTPRESRVPWLGGCAEVACLEKAIAAGVEPSGGYSSAANIGVSGEGHGTPKVECAACRYVLSAFGVRFGNIR